MIRSLIQILFGFLYQLFAFVFSFFARKKGVKLSHPGKTLFYYSGDNAFIGFVDPIIEYWKQAYQLPVEFVISESSPNREVRRSFFGWCAYFQSKKFRTIIFLNPNYRTDRKQKLAAWLMRTPHRVGFTPSKNFDYLNISLFFNIQNGHYLHQLKNLLEYATVTKIKLEPILYSESTVKRNHLKAKTNESILIALDANMLDPLETENISKLINLLSRTFSIDLLLSGQDAARIAARKISHPLTDHALSILNPVVDATQNEISLLIQQCTLATGNDYASLIEASQRQIPTISFFSSLNERIWQPFSNKSRAMTVDLPCRPCQKFPDLPIECKHSEIWACRHKIPAEIVYANILSILNKE